jgi:hypothetical protein
VAVGLVAGTQELTAPIAGSADRMNMNKSHRRIPILHFITLPRDDERLNRLTAALEKYCSAG